MKKIFILLLFLPCLCYAQTNIITPIDLLDDEVAFTRVDELLVGSENNFILATSNNTLSTLMINPNDFSLSVGTSLTLTNCESLESLSEIILVASGEFAYYLCETTIGEPHIGLVEVNSQTGALTLLNDTLLFFPRDGVTNGNEDFSGAIRSFIISPDNQNLYASVSIRQDDETFLSSLDTYSIDLTAGQINLQQQSPPASARLIISPDGRHVYTISTSKINGGSPFGFFFSNSIQYYERGADGFLTELGQFPLPAPSQFYLPGSDLSFDSIFSNDGERIYTQTNQTSLGENNLIGLNLIRRNTNTGLLTQSSDEQAIEELAFKEPGITNDIPLTITGKNSLLISARSGISAYRLNSVSGEIVTLLGSNLNQGFAPINAEDNDFRDILTLPEKNVLYAAYDEGIALFEISTPLTLDAVEVPILSSWNLYVLFGLFFAIGCFLIKSRD